MELENYRNRNNKNYPVKFKNVEIFFKHNALLWLSKPQNCRSKRNVYINRKIMKIRICACIMHHTQFAQSSGSLREEKICLKSKFDLKKQIGSWSCIIYMGEEWMAYRHHKNHLMWALCAVMHCSPMCAQQNCCSVACVLV